MKTITQDIVRCPSCRSGFLYTDAIAPQHVRCKTCQSAFSYNNQIINLLPSTEQSRSLAQYFMESPIITHIYESRLWRRNPVFEYLTGISFNEEFKKIVHAGKIDHANKILDLACGSGIYLRPIAQKNPNAIVVGLDMSPSMLTYASQQIEIEKLTNTILIRGNALDLPFSEQMFNSVNCCGALHLFPDVDRVLQEVYRILVPGGRFTTGVFLKHIGIIGSLMAQSQKYFVGVDSFTAESLTAALSRQGFAEIACHHAKGVWLIMHAQKPL